MSWVRAVESSRLRAGLGVAALVDGHQVAVLRDDRGDVHAIDNRDPFTGANVLARGLVEDVDGVATVASPLRKQRFELATGLCLEDRDRSVTAHPVRETDGWVLVRLAGEEPTPDLPDPTPDQEGLT